MAQTVTSYRHKVDTPVQEPDTQEGNYYVSVVDGPKHGFLLGPFKNDHARALSMVEQVRAKAEEVDPRAVFYGFGTCRAPLDYAKPGVLNEFFPEVFGGLQS